MDRTHRQITKIAREAASYVRTSMALQGVGSGEADMLPIIRKRPGITPGEVASLLCMPKAAITRRVANLVSKGFLRKEPDSADRRRSHLYATEKCEAVKDTKTDLEAGFYEWLICELDDKELETFCTTLGKLYQRSKTESRQGFPHLGKEA